MSLNKINGNLEVYGYDDSLIKLISNTGNGSNSISIQQTVIDNSQNAKIEAIEKVNEQQETTISGNTENINNILQIISGATETVYDAGEW